MTEVIKNIRGIDHFYYQDTIKGRNMKTRKIVTTLISRVDVPHDKFIQNKHKALVKHFQKLSTIQNQRNEAETEDYHFENPPDQSFLERLNFDYVRAEYFTIRKVLSAEELDYIDDQFFTRHVSGTTRIEGNTLEYNDVLKILKLEKSPDISSPLRDIHEVENYLVIKDYLKKPSKISINENTIKTIHKHLMNGLTVVKMAGKRKPVPAGVYRKDNALLSNIPFKISPPELIEQRIQYLLAEYRDQVKRKVHPVEIAAIFHQRFEEIHPFTDGNGRTGREVLNLMLIQNGYPPIYLTRDSERRYYEALKEGNNGNYVPLLNFILHRIIATLLFYWSKTSIFDIWKSDEFRRRIPPDHGEIHSNLVRNLEEYRNNDDAP